MGPTAQMKSEDLYTRFVALADLPEFIRELGCNPEELFVRAGLDVALASSNEHFISWNKMALVNTERIYERQF